METIAVSAHGPYPRKNTREKKRTAENVVVGQWQGVDQTDAIDCNTSSSWSTPLVKTGS